MAQPSPVKSLIVITYRDDICLFGFPHPPGATESEVLSEFRKDDICSGHMEDLHRSYTAEEDETLIGIIFRLLSQSDTTKMLGRIELFS